MLWMYNEASNLILSKEIKFRRRLSFEGSTVRSAFIANRYELRSIRFAVKEIDKESIWFVAILRLRS
jgi:hypothetical protein